MKTRKGKRPCGPCSNPFQSQHYHKGVFFSLCPNYKYEMAAQVRRSNDQFPVSSIWQEKREKICVDHVDLWLWEYFCCAEYVSTYNWKGLTFSWIISLLLPTLLLCNHIISVFVGRVMTNVFSECVLSKLKQNFPHSLYIWCDMVLKFVSLSDNSLWIGTNRFTYSYSTVIFCL
jgi:hypothetical protein